MNERRRCSRGVKCLSPHGPEQPLAEFPWSGAGQKRCRRAICKACAAAMNECVGELQGRTPEEWERRLVELGLPWDVEHHLAKLVFWDFCGRLKVAEAGSWGRFEEKYMARLVEEAAPLELLREGLTRLGYWDPHHRLISYGKYSVAA